MKIPQSHNFAIAQFLLITVFILLLTGLPRGTSAKKLARRPSEHKVAPRADKASPDNPWHDADDVVARAIAGKRLTGPKTSRTLTLDRAALTRVLADAPLEFSDQAKTRVTRLLLPLPDGTYESFRIEESPIMEFALAQKFPEIKTYRGQGINNPATTTRFDWTPAGFHALVLSTKGTVLIEPAMVDDTANYLAYFQHDVPVESFACGTSEGPQINEAVKSSGVGSLRTEVSNGTNLRTYRLAVAATAEYTQFYGGGTVGGGLSAVTTTVNLVDAIYEREVAVRLVLVANEDTIIFTDSATDGYTSDNASSLIGENQTKLDAVIGNANYDIGHVFDGRSSGGGFSFQGVATLGVVCRLSFKARGVSISRSLQPSAVVAYYSTAHEMGHQFNATHTFNATTGNCLNQRTSSTAYEPGTGSTIMGYRFTCGAEDLMSSDTYFHTASLEQIVNYITGASGNTCPTTTTTGNQTPTVDAGQNFTIPQNTPFSLTANGADPDGDALTYAWEEFDLGTAGPPNTDDGSRPIFRSFAPTTSPSRTFPRITDILNHSQTFGESLPTTTRTMNFHVTVRDNRSNGGGINSGAMQLNVTTASGPFAVTQPGADTWQGGSSQTISWAVANTANAPVSCGAVRILLSTDGGFTFPIVLANNTPNDGSEMVTIPTTPTGSARVKVEAVGNVFFNISSSNFTIFGPANNTPTITSFSPVNGMVGTSVTITGTNFINPQTVNFNGISATSFTLNSTTEIVTTVPAGATTGAITVTTPSGTATSLSTFTVGQSPATVQFNSTNYAVAENGGSATITVSRTGDLSGVSRVEYATADLTALQRTDYMVSAGTLTFAAGDTSRTFSVPIVDDAYVEGSEQLSLILSNPTGASLGTSSAILTINDNDVFPPTTNPSDTAGFFVRQHYLDFLSREPDPGGLGFWTGQITDACQPTDTICLNHRRRDVSDAFFFESEFQQTGGFIFRVYRAAFGNTQPFPNSDPAQPSEAIKLPSYAAFIGDRPKIIPGSGVAQSQQEFANAFVQRAAFISRYPLSLDGPGFVDAILNSIQVSSGVDLSSQRTGLIDLYNNGGRGAVLYRLADDNTQTNPIDNHLLIDAEYRRTFVFTEYAGYLRRDADIGGFLFWLNEVNKFPVRDVGIQHTMACAFISSAEYQKRFCSVVNHSNQECGQ